MEKPSAAAFEQGPLWAHNLQSEMPSYGKYVYKVNLTLTDVGNGASCLLPAHQCCLLDVNQGKRHNLDILLIVLIPNTNS
jgi:hypothetical protein